LTVVIFQDHRATPIFPRWLGYFSLWAGLLFIPGTTISYFHTGPLAWNGIFAYWLPLGVFAIWIFVVTAYVLRAIDQQQAEYATADSALGSTKPAHVG
jgi:hypothetical protein